MLSCTPHASTVSRIAAQDCKVALGRDSRPFALASRAGRCGQPARPREGVHRRDMTSRSSSLLPSGSPWKSSNTYSSPHRFRRLSNNAVARSHEVTRRDGLSPERRAAPKETLFCESSVALPSSRQSASLTVPRVALQ